MVLIEGSCTVDETMLTGESAPVTKSDIASYETQTDIFDPEKHKMHSSHLLSGGTTVIQLKSDRVVALVKATGFASTKGQMVKGMLLITDAQFTFYVDAIKFLGVMLLVALVCVAMTVKPMIDQEYAYGEMAFRLLDILTIAVPPALPAALTASVMFSLDRLKKQGVFCRAPPKILVGGRVNTMVFDKTGTLTEESIEGFIIAGETTIRKHFTGREESDSEGGLNNADVRTEQAVDEVSLGKNQKVKPETDSIN